VLKRNVAPQSHGAGESVERMTDNSPGHSKIVMKRQPAVYTVWDPQLHYILRLCHLKASPANPAPWIQRIDDYNARYDKDLTIIVSFMHLTSSSRNSGLLLTARSTDLETELNNVKLEADPGDHLVPMHNLLEPQVAASGMAALDEFVVKEPRARLGTLSEEIVQDALKGLEQTYTETKARL
jgi:hypothetical protein